MKFSLAVANVAQELRRAELEIEDIADEDIDAKMDYATELLRRITPVDTGYARSRWKTRRTSYFPEERSSTIHLTLIGLMPDIRNKHLLSSSKERFLLQN